MLFRWADSIDLTGLGIESVESFNFKSFNFESYFGWFAVQQTKISLPILKLCLFSHLTSFIERLSLFCGTDLSSCRHDTIVSFERKMAA